MPPPMIPLALLLCVGGAMSWQITTLPARHCKLVSLHRCCGFTAAEGDDSSLEVGGEGVETLRYAALDAIGKEAIDNALKARDRERILEGQPTYGSFEAMVESYKKFEGGEKTDAQYEDEVLRYLKQRSIMSEGADGIYDPQTIVTLVLLAALVLGIGKSLVTGALPTAS